MSNFTGSKASDTGDQQPQLISCSTENANSIDIDKLRGLCNHLRSIERDLRDQIPSNADCTLHEVSIPITVNEKIRSNQEILIKLPCRRLAQRLSGIVNSIISELEKQN